MALSDVKGRWALILGASSGMGAAIATKLAEEGFNIAGVHLDRKGTLPKVELIRKGIEDKGVQVEFFNVNAADAEKRRVVVEKLASLTQGQGVGCLVHSLAFGTLKPFFGETEKDSITKDQMSMTLDVMANSLVYWSQDLFRAKLLAKSAKIFALTSSGSTRVWYSYGAVSAAKSALESHCRQMALELAPHQIAVNAIRAGVTDTPALRKIPGHEQMIETATQRNPWKRLTTPENVADCIALLVHDEALWISGNVLGCDGAEDIVG